MSIADFVAITSVFLLDLIYLTSACSLLYLHNMKEHIRRFLYLLILLGISVDLYSNNPYIININKNRYGAANKNWSIGQDERGVVYFGNDNGLLEFDGFNWKINTIRNFSIVRAVAVLIIIPYLLVDMKISGGGIEIFPVNSNIHL